MSSFDDIDREIDREMGWNKDKPGQPSLRRTPGYWQALLLTARVSSPLWRTFRFILRSIAKVVFFPIITPLGYSKHLDGNGDMVVVKRSFFWRVGDAILTRVLLTPIILAIFLAAVVYANTHPRTLRAFNTPDGYGLYYKRVSLVTVDNQRLTTWYIPPMNADEVAFDPQGTLVQKWPAVVICHGLGATHDQYLPLAKYLHTVGFAVLMVDTRGQGESDPAAVTYGLRERLDVLAGVKLLREMSYIDSSKICVVGHDISAMAALQAATLDSSIAVVVADGLWPKFEDRARDIFGRPTARLSGGAGGNLPSEYLAPLYTLAFEIAIRDRLNQLDPETIVRNIHTQPVLFIAREGPEYAPTMDILKLATTTTSKHEVILANGDWERHICNFLIQNTHWKGPNARGAAQIEDFLKSRVDPIK